MSLEPVQSHIPQLETGRGCVQFLYKSGLQSVMLDFSLPLSGCHPVSPSSFEVPRSLFSVPEGFCLADKTLIRGCVDTITLILCPCRCQASETTSLALQSPEGCLSPLRIPPGAGKHQGIRKTPITFVCICVSLLLQAPCSTTSLLGCAGYAFVSRPREAQDSG